MDLILEIGCIVYYNIFGGHRPFHVALLFICNTITANLLTANMAAKPIPHMQAVVRCGVAFNHLATMSIMVANWC